MNSYEPWKPPFKYDEHGGITDSKEHKILDVRGWGFLTGKGYGAMGLNEGVASEIQDRIAERICEVLNKDWKGMT
jgi:hypothetical protein